MNEDRGQKGKKGQKKGRPGKKKKAKAIPCNKCSFKAKLVETYEGLVGDYVHHRGIYKCFSGHKQDKLLSVKVLEDSPRD
jgi:hypothetical protein